MRVFLRALQRGLRASYARFVGAFFLLCMVANLNPQSSFVKPRVLFVHRRGGIFGGVANDLITRHRQFLNHGVGSMLLAYENTRIVDKMRKEGLPFALIRGGPRGINMRGSCLLPENPDHIYRAMFEACRKYNLNTIFCLSPEQLQAAKRVKRSLPIKIIYVEHNQLDYWISQHADALGASLNNKRVLPAWARRIFVSLGNVDGCIGVNKNITEALQMYTDVFISGQSKVRHFATIKPFLNDAKFLSFESTEPRADYFQRVYRIQVDDDTTVIAMVALFYSLKQHEVFIRALADLMRTGGYKVKVMLAGNGSTMGAIRQLAVRLNVAQHIHFLGFIDDPEALLHHSDVHVLSSKIETAGLVTAEAGLMKKPVIVPQNTGTADLVVPGVTGLCFKNSDSRALAASLRTLLDNPKKRLDMGLAGYKHMRQHFSTEEIFKQTMNFLERILNEQPAGA